MKPKTKKNNQEENGWLALIQNFVEKTLSQIGDDIMEKVNAWADDFRIRMISSVFMIIGMTFLLLGMAFYINNLVSVNMQWIGFLLAGLIAMLVGFLLARK